MSLTLDGSTSELVSAISPLGLTYPYSEASWFKGGTTSSFLYTVGDAGFSASGAFMYPGTGVSAREVGPVEASVFNPPDAAAWNLILTVFVSAIERKCFYKSPTPGTDTGLSVHPLGNYDQIRIGGSTEVGAPSFLGDVAEYAIWNADVSSSYVALAAGASPSSINFAALFDHWTLTTQAPTHTGVKGRVLTATNTTQGASHPPVDPPPPSLVTPVGIATGKDAGTAGATTNTGAGVIYAIACSSITPATGAQIEAGLDAANVAADSSGNTGTLTTSGAKTIPMTAITENAARYMQLVQKVGAVYSNVVVSAVFNTSTLAYSGTIAAQVGTIGSAFTFSGANPSTLFTGGIGTKTITESTALLAGRGLAVNGNTGVITGTPTGAAGTISVSLKDTDTSTAGTEVPQVEVSNAFDIVFTVSGAPPTSATLTGPSTGPTGSASANFTVTLNAPATATVTVTPAGTNGAVTFVPPSPSIAIGQTAVTFTANPALDGLHNISITTSPVLTYPGSPRAYISGSGVYSLPIGPGFLMAGGTKLINTLGQWSAWQSGDVGTLGAPAWSGSSTSDSNGVWAITGLPAPGITRVLIKNTSGEFVGYWVGNAA